MKTLLLGAVLLSCAITASAGDVAVSIQVGDPGFYGRIDIGNVPQPQVIYRQPVIITREVNRPAEIVYLRVPPGHAKNWHKYCERYNACYQQVYFIHENYYREHYAEPRRHEREREHEDDRRDDHERKHGHDRDHDNRNKQERGNDHEHGNDRERGHD